MRWKPKQLRDSAVWAEVNEADEIVADSDGRVMVIYKAGEGAKVYRARKENLTDRDGATISLNASEEPAPTAAKPTAQPAARSTGRGKGATTAAAAAASAPPDAITIWTDGGCAPNPGPGGIGVVIIDGAKRQEFGDYLGDTTNNICELTAILRGLQAVTDRARPVVVYADSNYAIGVISQGWKAKANTELVMEIRALCKSFTDLRFVKVAAHTGIAENERVDTLVAMARSKRGLVSSQRNNI